MKRPWQIGIGFALCLGLAAPALAWLTLQVLALDRAEALAQKRAALEEKVNLALWRMDTFLAPLLAQEATRPTYAFQPFYAAPGSPRGGNGHAAPSVPSPLLRQRPEYVRLHFQAFPGDRWTSPQAPPGDVQELAAQHALAAATLHENEARLQRLQDDLRFDEVLPYVPEEMLPAFGPEALAWTEQAREEQFADAPVVANSYGYGPPRGQGKGGLPQEPDGTYSPKGAAAREFRQQRSVTPSENDLSLRNRALQVYAQQQVIDQRLNVKFAAPRSAVMSEGVSRPFWIGDKLLLARRVQMSEDLIVQGCWLDWEKIQARLKEEVADLLPALDLMPVVEGDAPPPSRVLATLPVQVVVPEPAAGDRRSSPIQIALLVAWGCLIAATLAVAALLGGVVALSERRAAFVAAVTHELRTPLTTFRMYAEMLAHEMAPPEKRREYLETLQVEADRLTHLVENVLAYARLERGARQGRRLNTTVAELISTCAPRLALRAAQADMELVVEIDGAAEAAAVVTDAQAVEQILFNLVDNAAKYAVHAQDRRIGLSCRVQGKFLEVRVCDHGPGVSPSQRRRLFRPFSKTVEEAAVTAPGVGLGLALSQRLAQDLGGRLELEPTSRDGACFLLRLPLSAKPA